MSKLSTLLITAVFTFVAFSANAAQGDSRKEKEAAFVAQSKQCDGHREKTLSKLGAACDPVIMEDKCVKNFGADKTPAKMQQCEAIFRAECRKGKLTVEQRWHECHTHVDARYEKYEKWCEEQGKGKCL